MTTLETGKGRVLEIEYVTAMSRERDRILIGMRDERLLSEIADDLEGCGELKKKDSSRPGVTELYDGYTELTDIRRMGDGMVRITLRKP